MQSEDRITPSVRVLVEVKKKKNSLVSGCLAFLVFSLNHKSVSGFVLFVLQRLNQLLKAVL